MNHIFTKLDTKKIVIELLNTFEKANFDYYSRAYLESQKGTFCVSFGNCQLDDSNIITIYIDKAPHEFYFTHEHSNIAEAHHEAINLFKQILDFYFIYLKQT